MLCAAIDIGSNTTRVLVAESIDGQLKKVMEQRAYTRISKAVDEDGAITAGQDRRGRRAGRDAGAPGAGARRGRDPRGGDRGGARGDQRAGGGGGDLRARPGSRSRSSSGEEEGRLSFIGATKALGHPVDGPIGVVDVGGGSTEVILGTVPGGVGRGALLARSAPASSPTS